MTLRHLPTDQIVWTSPEQDPVTEVIVPALNAADQFDCMVGYFGIGALKGLAHGLANFITRTDKPIRLLIGPTLSSVDKEAIELSQKPREDIVKALEINLLETLEDPEILGNALAEHTKECFAYLLATGQITIKIVIQSDGQFHPKTWIWREGNDVAVLSGSANFTGRALFDNTEQSSLLHSWGSEEQATACSDQIETFERYFSEGPPNSQLFDLPEAIKNHLIKNYTNTPLEPPKPLNDKLKEAEQVKIKFAIPENLVWEEGLFKHQGEAVNAWEAAQRQGILAMATGSGKTITALIAAWKLWNEEKKLAIFVAAPTKPLVAQWLEECRAFNLSPIDVGSFKPSKRFEKIEQRLSNIELSDHAIEVFVGTSNFLKDESFQDLLEQYDNIPVLLIADEVHNFGTESILNALPASVKYRLGLSATPIRQYDEQGTAELLEFFGDVAFEFDLEDAIGLCLVPYDYYLHPIYLTTNEMADYRELSEKISKLIHLSEDGGSDNTALQILLNKRRLILETAKEKLSVLEEILKEAKRSLGEVRHTLIYATDKDPDQLIEVNSIVQNLNIPMHQITDAETTSNKLTASLVQNFRDGSLQVLTAKRVLDEGFDIPEISMAIILASTTVERQWVQRRGRVLRLSPQTKKESSTIHDFFVLPPDHEHPDSFSKKLVENEKKRCYEFLRLSRNKTDGNAAANLIADASRKFLN